MVKGNFPTQFPLKHQQKDVKLACDLGDEVGQYSTVQYSTVQYSTTARTVRPSRGLPASAAEATGLATRPAAAVLPTSLETAAYLQP